MFAGQMLKEVLRLLPTVFLSLCCFFAGAQDRYFTQFYSIPAGLNPALTGGYSGKYRVSAVYRDQWRGPLEKPVTTLGASVDLRFEINPEAAYNDAASVGLQFFSDHAGPFKLSTNVIGLSGAFHKSLSSDDLQVISAGFSLQAVQRNLLYEHLFFQDQFNGIDAFDHPTQEDLPENNFTYGDLNFGLNYTITPAPKWRVYLGGGIHHIMQPEVSFYKKDDDERQQEKSSSKLFRNYTVHGGALIPLATTLALSPRAFFALQGPHLVSNLGANLILEPGVDENFKLHLGGWFRMVRDFDRSIKPDAIGLLVGINIRDLLLGLSYDINIRDIINYPTGQGALEFSVSYFGDYESENDACPSF